MTKELYDVLNKHFKLIHRDLKDLKDRFNCIYYHQLKKELNPTLSMRLRHQSFICFTMYDIIGERNDKLVQNYCKTHFKELSVNYVKSIKHCRIISDTDYPHLIFDTDVSRYYFLKHILDKYKHLK